MNLSTKKILLIACLSFLFIREFTSFELSYYRSNYNSTSTYQSSCNTSKYDLATPYLSYDIDLDTIDEINIIYKGLEEPTNTYSNHNTIVVNVVVPKFVNWRYYTPFYKSINLNHRFS